MYKYLVEMYDIASNTSEPICFCDTEEKAKEWIDNEIYGYEYTGTGYYRIKKIKYYD